MHDASGEETHKRSFGTHLSYQRFDRNSGLVVGSERCRYSYGLCSYGLCSYGLSSYGLYGYDLYSYGHCSYSGRVVGSERHRVSRRQILADFLRGRIPQIFRFSGSLE